MANPFKVGDLVVRVDSARALPQKVAVVDGNFCRVVGSPTFYHYSDYKRYAPPEEVIVIVTDGTESKAYLKRDGKKVNEVKIKRSKDDKHDLKVLTAYAVQKLLPVDDRELVARPAGYCGAVAVTANTPDSTLRFKPGLIMEFFGGKWKEASVWSCLYGVKFSNFDELASYMAKHGTHIVELHRNA